MDMGKMIKAYASGTIENMNIDPYELPPNPIKLIKEIKKNKCLYDPKDRYAKNTVMKELIWVGLATDVMPEHMANIKLCQDMWEYLCDTFYGRVTDENGKVVECLYRDQLQFLRDTEDADSGNSDDEFADYYEDEQVGEVENWQEQEVGEEEEQGDEEDEQEEEEDEQEEEEDEEEDEQEEEVEKEN